MKYGAWPHLYALLMARGASDWRWQLVESEPGQTPVRALVQDDGRGGTNVCGVFAMGETLSVQARVIEQVSPKLLKELGERAMLMEDCRERLERLEQTAKRLRNRAYKNQRSDEYQDMLELRATLEVLKKLLASTSVPGLDDLRAWEDDARRDAGRAPPA